MYMYIIYQLIFEVFYVIQTLFVWVHIPWSTSEYLCLKHDKQVKQIQDLYSEINPLFIFDISRRQKNSHNSVGSADNEDNENDNDNKNIVVGGD